MPSPISAGVAGPQAYQFLRLPGSQPANITPDQQRRIQDAMLKGATSSRDYYQQQLAKPSAEFQADEVARLQQARQSTADSADFTIQSAARFAQGDSSGFWVDVQQRAEARKTTDLAAIDQQIATVPQREPELRSEMQRTLDFVNQRIAELQAGPVPISQAVADSYLQQFAIQDAQQARLARFQQSYGADVFVG